MSAGGLLIAGMIIPVPGVDVVGPHDAAWAHLTPGDGRPRTNWPQMGILHKVLADDPERVLPGPEPRKPGVPRHAERTAEYWAGDPAHSGAHIVVDDLGAACLADLILFCAWHGNQANQRSIGIEHAEEPGGIVREQTLVNGVKVALAISEFCGIQLQVPRPGSYAGAPMRRFVDGGSTLCGWFGHRDVTSSRGRWDPGDQLFLRLVAAGAEAYDFNAGEDLAEWKHRQVWLNARGHNLLVDGVPGRHTTEALIKEGFRGGVWALGRP